MFKEWIKTLRRYFQKANGVLAKDINGKPFLKGSQWIYKLSFWIIACAVVCFLPKGLSDGFIEYIKDIFAIFVGFFVTVLCFVFDKLDTRRILSEEERNALFKPRGTYRAHQEYRPQKTRSANVSYNRPLKALRSQSSGASSIGLQTVRVQNGVISVGTRVEHATFGVGVVLRIENNMTGLKAVINFINCGEKTLLLKYAKLNVID